MVSVFMLDGHEVVRRGLTGLLRTDPELNEIMAGLIIVRTYLALRR